MLTALNDLEWSMSDLGVNVPRGYAPFKYLKGQFAGIRRVDLTADVTFETAAEGLAFLVGVAAVSDGGQFQRRLIYQPGGAALETVYLHGRSGGKVLGRVYDKGIESGLAPRGRLIRPEGQYRWGGGRRRDVEEVANAETVRNMMRKRFVPLWQASKGVKVAGPFELADSAIQQVADGEMKPGTAARLIGSVFMDVRDQQSERRVLPDRTRRRWKAERRKAGLVLADGVLDEVEVDVQEVMESILDHPGWQG